MSRVLRGDHCQCPACGLYFNSTYAFDCHRTGKHGVDRRCMTMPDMRAAGMALSASGWWISARREAAEALGIVVDPDSECSAA